MRFPSVTICNQNRIKESLILDNNATRFKDLADIGRLFEGCKGRGHKNLILYEFHKT